MNNLFITDPQAHSLIILFLGWGFPPEAFSGLRKPGFDILLIAGYKGKTGEMLEDEIRASVGEATRGNHLGYSEIVVIGWSFGVKAASMFLAQTKIQVSMRLAVNGTEHHISDEKGIPANIFDGTLAGLSERNIGKFRLRSAGSRENLQRLERNLQGDDATSVAALRDELEWFGSISPLPPSKRIIWDKAVIGDEDHIFPPANQLRSWDGYDIFTVPGMPHLPDFQWVIDNFVVDKVKVCDKFTTAGFTYTDNAVVQRETAKKLYGHFTSIFDSSKLKEGGSFRARQLAVIELGYGDGTFTRLYVPSLTPHCRKITLCDIIDDNLCFAANLIEDYVHDDECEVVTCYTDAESAEFANQYLKGKSTDIIFSSSMFQWLNSPGMMLRKCANALRHGGIIAISFYGPGTFKEIHRTVGTGLKYPSPEWMERIARECRLDINLVESEEITMQFDTPADALRHLKLTGVNALPGIPSPARARYLLNNWPLDKEGKAPLTFRPVYMVLSKK